MKMRLPATDIAPINYLRILLYKLGLKAADMEMMRSIFIWEDNEEIKTP